MKIVKLGKEKNENQTRINNPSKLEKIEPKSPEDASKTQFLQIIRRQHHGRWFNKDVLDRKARIKNLFGILQKTSQTLNFKASTFCAMIHIFDSVISTYPTTEDRMLPVGLVSLQLAAKLEETRQNLINYDEVNSFICSLGVPKFIKMEPLVIEILNFSINLQTPEKIIRFLLNEFMKPKYDFFGETSKSQRVKRRFFSLVLRLHLITLIEYDFYQFTSVGVAMGVLFLARKLIGLMPCTQKIFEFTQLSENDVSQPMFLLERLYHAKYVSKVFRRMHLFSGVDKELLGLGRIDSKKLNLFDNCENYCLSVDFMYPEFIYKGNHNRRDHF